MRVLAFIEALGLTGPARNLLESSSGLDLHVGTYRRRGADHHEAGIAALARAFEARGVPVIVIDERRRFDPAVLRGMRAAIDRVRPDVVQTHNIKSHALMAAAQRGVRVPWVAFHHGYTDTDFKMRVYNRLDRHALRHADAVVTPCEAFVRELEEAGVDSARMSVLHNAVDAAPVIDRDAVRHALGVAGRRVILSVGRLSREKGHDVLIDACARLNPGLIERLCVLIVGDGPERAALERRAASAGVPVRFEGFQSSIDRYYAAADVFVLPSRSEGSPNALLEALAAGCPSIAARVGGVPEIVTHGVSAWLVPPEDPERLRDAIAYVLSNRSAAAGLAEEARRTASRMTRAGRHAQLHSIYQRVILRSRSAAGVVQ